MQDPQEKNDNVSCQENMESGSQDDKETRSMSGHLRRPSDFFRRPSELLR